MRVPVLVMLRAGSACRWSPRWAQHAVSISCDAPKPTRDSRPRCTEHHERGSSSPIDFNRSEPLGDAVSQSRHVPSLARASCDQPLRLMMDNCVLCPARTQRQHPAREHSPKRATPFETNRVEAAWELSSPTCIGYDCANDRRVFRRVKEIAWISTASLHKRY